MSNPAARKSFKENTLPSWIAIRRMSWRCSVRTALRSCPFTKLFDEDSVDRTSARVRRAFADQVEAATCRPRTSRSSSTRGTMSKEELKAPARPRKSGPGSPERGGSRPQQAELPPAVLPDGDRAPVDNPWFELAASPSDARRREQLSRDVVEAPVVDQWYTIPVMTDEDARISRNAGPRRQRSAPRSRSSSRLQRRGDKIPGPASNTFRAALAPTPPTDAWPWTPFGATSHPPPEESTRHPRGKRSARSPVPAGLRRSSATRVVSTAVAGSPRSARGSWVSSTVHLAGCDGIAVPPQLHRRGCRS